MKIKNIFAAVLLAGICTSASAQFSTSTGNTNSADEWSSAYVQINPISVDAIADFTGISVGYNKAYSISSNKPLFVEVGGKITYAWGDSNIFAGIGNIGNGGNNGGNNDNWEDYWDDYLVSTRAGYSTNTSSNKFDLSLLTLTIPVNLTYIFAIPNSEITIAPFAGIDVKYHIIGKVKNDDYDYNESFFDKDKNGGFDTKRLNFGYNIGANVNYKNLYGGFSWGTDFTEIFGTATMETTSITFGYKF